MRALCLLLLLTTVVAAQNHTLTVGLLFVRNNTFVGYEQSAAAVLIAQDRIWRENLLPNVTFK